MSQTAAPTETIALKQTLEPGLPVRLLIPSLKIDAKIISVGLTKEGDMEAPFNVLETGWYKYGTRPGDKGSAVIDGHRTDLKGKPAVFSNLGKLSKGDIFSVVDDKGQTFTFSVRETRNYGKDENPEEVFTSSDGSHLNLITCVGSWDKESNSFSKRLVVFSDRIN